MSTILTATGVNVDFGGLHAVAAMDLTADEGRVTAIIGPNGAGKTTFFNTISGHQNATSGRVEFRGQDVTGMGPDGRARMGMARTFQTGGLISDLTVYENVVLGRDLSARSRAAATAEAAAPVPVTEVLEEFGLTRHSNALAGKLPAGTRRLVEVARSVASGARLILLDEPAVGLSEGERNHLGSLIRRRAGTGTAFIITDHVADFLFGVADHVTAMNFGRLLAQGTPAEVRSNPQVAEAYLGRHATRADQ
jgi:branched-chain amino acid transport system ATP-binding protein